MNIEFSIFMLLLPFLSLLTNSCAHLSFHYSSPISQVPTSPSPPLSTCHPLSLPEYSIIYSTHNLSLCLLIPHLPFLLDSTICSTPPTALCTIFTHLFPQSTPPPRSIYHLVALALSLSFTSFCELSSLFSINLTKGADSKQHLSVSFHRCCLNR